MAIAIIKSPKVQIDFYSKLTIKICLYKVKPPSKTDL